MKYSLRFQTPGTGSNMGQREGFSPSDLAKINAMYCKGQNQNQQPNQQQRPNQQPIPNRPQGPPMINRPGPGMSRPNVNRPSFYPNPDYYPDYYENFVPGPNRPPPNYGGPIPPNYPDYGGFNHYGPPRPFYDSL